MAVRKIRMILFMLLICATIAAPHMALTVLADTPGSGSGASTSGDEDPWKKYEDIWYADMPWYKSGTADKEEPPGAASSGDEDPWKKYEDIWYADLPGYNKDKGDGGGTGGSTGEKDSPGMSSGGGPGAGIAAGSGGSGGSSGSSGGSSGGSSSSGSSGGSSGGSGSSGSSGSSSGGSSSSEEGEAGSSEGTEKAGEVTGIDQTIERVVGWTDSTDRVREMLDEGFELIYDVFEELSDGSGDLRGIFYMAKGIGILIMTMCLVIDISARDLSATFGKPTLEMLSKPLIRYVVALIFILYLEKFLQLILLLSQWAYMQVEMPPATEITIPDYKETIKTALGYSDSPKGPLDLIKNALASAQLYITFLLPTLITNIAFIGTGWVVYSRTVNLVVSALAAPLGMPDLFSDKPLRDTRAFVYLRRFAGLCFQSFVIILVCLVLNLLTGELLTNLVDGLNATTGAAANIADLSTFSLKLSVFKLVEFGVLMGTANKAKEIMGGA